LRILDSLWKRKKDKGVTFDVDDLRNWVSKELAAGTPLKDVKIILSEKTGWPSSKIDMILKAPEAVKKLAKKGTGKKKTEKKRKKATKERAVKKVVEKVVRRKKIVKLARSSPAKKVVRKVAKMPLRQKIVSKKSPPKEQDMLKDALADLNRELRILRSSRKRLEFKMESLNHNFSFTQNKEIDLRSKISQLMREENAIEKKKASTKDQLVVVDQKIEKVKSIGQQLKGV